MKHDWLNWLSACLVIEGLWVQILLRTKLHFLFLPNFLLGMDYERV